MFFPSQLEATIGMEARSRVVRLGCNLTTAFTAGNSILNIRTGVTPCLPLAALWLSTERSSLNWAGLTGCFIPHTARDRIVISAHGVELGAAFKSKTAKSA